MDLIRVGVSGINAADNPGPGIAVARSLKEDGGLAVEVAGLAYDFMEPGIYLDWVVDKTFMLPYPSTGGLKYIDRLLYIKNTHGLDLVIPNLDAELPVYIKYAEVLAENGIRTFLPDMKQFRLRGKDKLGEIAGRIGLEIPKTEVVFSREQLIEAVGKIGPRVMIKGIYCGADQADSLPEALENFHKVAAEWGYPVIVQEVVAGQHLNVVGLGDGRGEILGLVGIKKVSLTSLGKIWTGVTVRHREMLEAAGEFIRAYQWRGPFELECIRAEDGIKLIEINPRFPAWCYFATGVGVNLPARLLRRCLNLDHQTGTDYEAGRLFVRYSYDLVTDLNNFKTLVLRGENQ